MSTTPSDLIAHSILSADALAREVAARYDLPGRIRAQLLFRGMNDVYVVSNGDTRWALRVWRGTWRPLEEVRNELDFLNFLRARGFPASFPVAQRNGEWHFTLPSPEATRAVALYEWAPGSKVYDHHTPETAADVGRLFARMHDIGRDYRPAVDIDLRPGQLDEDLPALMDLLYDRPEEAAFYADAGPRVHAAIQAIGRFDLPQGACHGDLHPGNAHITTDAAGARHYTFLDFDGCGNGYYLKDIANYIFGSDFYGFDPALGQAFLAGYDSIRAMTPDERELLDFFVFCKTFQLVAGIARNVNSVGRASLRFRGLDWFAAQVRAGMARHAGLIGSLG